MHLPRRVIYDYCYGYIPQYWLLWWHNCDIITDPYCNVYPLAFDTLEEAKNYWTNVVWKE